MKKELHHIVNTFINPNTGGSMVYQCLINDEDHYFIDETCGDNETLDLDESDLIEQA